MSETDAAARTSLLRKTQEGGSVQPAGRSGRLAKTGLFCLTFLAMGMAAEITGPTLDDLRLRLGTTYLFLSGGISLRCKASLLGNILGGFLVDSQWMSKYSLVLYGLVLLTMGAVYWIPPWLGTVWPLFPVFFVYGFTEGILRICQQREVLVAWSEKAAPALHSLHLSHGVGALLAPQLAKPFISSGNLLASLIRPATKNSTRAKTLYNGTAAAPVSVTMTTGLRSMTTSGQAPKHASQIQYPFAIVAATLGFLGLCYLLLQVDVLRQRLQAKKRVADEAQSGPTHKKSCDNTLPAKSDKGPNRENVEMAQPAATPQGEVEHVSALLRPASTCAGGHVCFGATILALLWCYLFLAMIAESAPARFIASYSTHVLKMPAEQAMLLNTVFWLAFTGGRFLAFAVSHVRMVPVQLVQWLVVLGYFGAAVLFLLRPRDQHIAWATVTLLGLFCGPLYSSVLVWADAYITLTGLALTIITSGAIAGSIVNLWLLGGLYDMTPLALTYMVSAIGVLLCTVMLPLQLIASLHVRRHGNERTNA